MKKKFIKLHWEFWPVWLMYLPLLFIWPYYMLRLRKIRFWEYINPGIYNGGLLGDSKFKSLSQLPKKNVPKQILVDKNIEQDELLNLIKKADIIFPFIAKPDTGMNGRGVKKIKNENELKKYFKNIESEKKTNFIKKLGMILSKTNDLYWKKILIQELINTKEEFGVFYIRKPKEEKGSIYSMIKRELLEIKGDDVHNLKELIQQHPRAWIYEKKFLKKYKKSLNTILKNNESMILESIGNHILGVTFKDQNHLINDKLINIFDSLSKNINGFYYGRYDLKTESYEDMLNGNFKVLEINGANSEATHMYDPKMKPLQGWRIIIRFWNMAYVIARQNKKPL